MPPKRQRRGREGGGGDGDGGGGDGRGEAVVRGGGGSTQAPAPPAASPAPATKRLCLPCNHPEIRCCGCSHRQGLPTACPCVQAYQRKIEAAMSRFMAEMTEPPPSPCGLTPSPRERIEQNLLPTYKLTFANTMSDKIIFTKREVKAAGGGPLKIKMAVSNQQDSNCAQLLSANVKVVVLDGDFNENNRESWTLEEFESHIVRPRDKVGVVLTGKLELKLKNGEAHVENITFSDLGEHEKAQVEEWSRDAYESMTYHQPDYEMYDSQPRKIYCSTFQGSIVPGHKSTEPTDEIIPEADEQVISEGNRLSGNLSQQFTLRRAGSRRVRAPLPCAQGNNETDVPSDIDAELGSGPAIQYQTPNANHNASSVILPCPPEDESEALHQAAMTASASSVIVHQDGQMSFTNVGPSLDQWSTEQQVDSQYETVLSPRSQADLRYLLMQNGFSIDQLWDGMPNDFSSQFCASGVNNMQADVCCGMAKLPCRRWVKLAVLAKWLAMLRVSKARFLLEQNWVDSGRR